MVEIIPNWHPIFVHFTVALLTVGAMLKVGSYLAGGESLREQWRLVARWNLWIGAGFVVLTVLSGVFAYNTVAHDTPSHAAMTDHRNWALITAVVFLVITGWLVLLVRADKARNGLFIALLLVAMGLLAVTAWKGGELVYRHGLGVMSLPKADTHEHAEGEHHDHGTAMHGTAMKDAHDHLDSHSDTHHEEHKADEHHEEGDGHHHEATTVHHHDNGTSHQHHEEPSTSPETSTSKTESETSKDDHFADGHTH